MNVALGRQPWGSPNFVDPDIRDAPLEPSGLAGALGVDFGKKPESKYKDAAEAAAALRNKRR